MDLDSHGTWISILMDPDQDIERKNLSTCKLSVLIGGQSQQTLHKEFLYKFKVTPQLCKDGSGINECGSTVLNFNKKSFKVKEKM